MAKFHINKHGVPAPCHAKEGNCPLGGDTGGENHFDTLEEAQLEADKINEENHGILPGFENDSSFEISNNLFEETAWKEVYIKTKDDKIIEGLVLTEESDSSKLKIQNGTESIVEINAKDIAALETSTNYYFSDEHNERLRESNRARMDFRFSEDDLADFDGKYVEVGYDGKNFAGKVIGTHYNGLNDSGLIVEMNEGGPVKHIKNYRMTDIEITGENKEEHNNIQMIKFLESELKNNNDVSALEEYPSSSNTTPSDMTRSYFEAKIANVEGANYDTSKITHDWVSELEENSDNPEYGIVEEMYYDDMIKAESANISFEVSKVEIDNLVDKIKEIDWTKYKVSQKDGELKALNHMFESGYVF